MKRQVISIVPALGLLAFGGQVSAAVTTTPIIGNLGSTIQTCLQQLTTSVSDGENCTYAGTSNVPAAQPFGEAIGPNSFGYYYSSVTTPQAFSDPTFDPTPGDGKITPLINGSITIDTLDSAVGTDHLISFTMVLTDPNGGDIIRSLGGSVVDRYTSLTQVLAPRTADAAAANGLGGFDYIIGTAGFPNLLVFDDPAQPACAGQAFGSMECDSSFAPGVEDSLKWTGWPASAGLGSLEGNLGAKTVGTLENPACAPTGTALPAVCTTNQGSFGPLYVGPNATTGGGSETVRGAAEDAGWDQLLLRVSTDAAGTVVEVAGFDVEEYRVFGAARCGDNTDGTGTYAEVCNSWTSSYFTATAVPAPAAVWLLGTGIAALAIRRRRARAAA